MLRESEKAILDDMQCQSFLRYARCVLWASDPEVLKKFFLQDGKFTLDKLLQKSTYAPGNFKNLDLPIADQLLPSLMAEVKEGNPVLYSEIIDDHTILLLLDPNVRVLPRIFGLLMQESPEYDVIFVPIPLNLIWDRQIEHLVRRADTPYKNTGYKYRTFFSFDDASVQFSGDYPAFRKVYSDVMQY